MAFIRLSRKWAISKGWQTLLCLPDETNLSPLSFFIFKLVKLNIYFGFFILNSNHFIIIIYFSQSSAFSQYWNIWFPVAITFCSVGTFRKRRRISREMSFGLHAQHFFGFKTRISFVSTSVFLLFQINFCTVSILRLSMVSTPGFIQF